MFDELSQPQKRKRAKIFRLRMTLVVPFVLQICAAVGLVGYLSFKNGQKAVTDLAFQLNDEVAARVDQTLETYVAIPNQINQSNELAIRLGELNLQNYAQLERHFWHQVQQFPSVTSILLGTEKREFTGVERIDKNKFHIDISRQATNYAHSSYAADGAGNRTKLITVNKQNYDPRKRPWYKAPAEARHSSVWSPIYAYVNSQTLAITNGLPFYGPNGNLLGVTATALSLSQISKFLQGLKVGKTGQVFVLERSGMLVATSTQEKPSRMTRGEAERFQASNSRDPVTQATARYLTNQFGSLKRINVAQQLMFKVDDKPQFLKLLPFQDRNGLDWLIVRAIVMFISQTVIFRDKTLPISAVRRSITSIQLRSKSYKTTISIASNKS